MTEIPYLMELYLLFKLGTLCTVIAAITALLLFVAIVIASISLDKYSGVPPIVASISKKSIIPLIIVFAPALVIANVSPKFYEVKNYAIYALTEKCSTSPQAKELFDAAIKYLNK